MTVVSPDTSEGTQTVGGTSYTWDTNNISTNVNNCPNNGTAPIPANGVVFVQNATTAQTQTWANPFDDPVDNSVTNLTSNPSSPTAGNTVTLTATVTSATNQLNAGATVAFSQTTRSGFPATTRSTVINSCSAQSLSTPVAVTPATSPPTYNATATCTTTESTSGTGAFSAAYSGGASATASTANLGQSYTLHSTTTYGPDAQTTAGGCSSCYYGQTSNPDAEGDAFVNGALSGQLTIGTANNVIIDGSLTYADCAGTWTTGQSGSSTPSMGLCPYSVGGTNDTLGLIANNYVEINRPILASSSGGNSPSVLSPCGATPAATCDPSDGTNGITVDAALLALTQSFVVNNYYDGGTEGNLTVYGSIQQYARGPVGTFNVNYQGVPSPASGYVKEYTWDPLLDFVSPPSYLVPSTPSWVLASVTTNAGVASASVCPPLSGVYAGTTNGVVQDGPAITQYCSTSPGGLPNYPSITAPSPPTGASAVANTSGTVTLNWTDPPSDNGSPISGYAISASPTCSGCTFSTLTGANVTSATITGLTPGGTYNFSVTATNGSGTSNPSTASNAVTIPNVPSAPTNVSATTNANGSITVSWTDPANNGSPITQYGVVPSPTCPGCTYTTLTGATLTSTTVSGLTRGTSYSFTVTASNAIGTGNASTASNTVTAPNVPGVPTGVTASAGNGLASVTWTAPGSTGGSAITGYVVTPYLNGTTAQTAQTFVSTATTEPVTGLTNGSAYTFKVAAINGVGTGSQSTASASVTLPTTPGAPTIGTATAGAGSASVTWTAPSSNGGSAITGYVVTPYIGTTAQTAQTFNSTATTETVTGLAAGTAYTFKVAAINAVGTGTQSAASGSVTTPTVPAAPAKPTTTYVSSGSLKVTWAAPANGGSTITGYLITPSSGSPVTVGNVTNYTFTGLTHNRGYTFTVSAINAVGTGPASPSSTSVNA
jgi:titin